MIIALVGGYAWLRVVIKINRIRRWRSYSDIQYSSLQFNSGGQPSFWSLLPSYVVRHLLLVLLFFLGGLGMLLARLQQAIDYKSEVAPSSHRRTLA